MTMEILTFDGNIAFPLSPVLPADYDLYHLDPYLQIAI